MAAAGFGLEHVGCLVAVFVDPGVACHAARDVVGGVSVERGGEVVGHVAVGAFAGAELELEPVGGKRERHVGNVLDEEVAFLAGRSDQDGLRKALGHLAGLIRDRDAVDGGREAAIGVALAEDELTQQAVCLVDLVERHVLKAAELGGLDAKHLQIFIGEALALFLGPERIYAGGLDYRFVKETGRIFPAHEDQQARGACALAENRYVIGISAEAVYIVADEFECQDLVVNTVVLVEILIQKMQVQEAFEIEAVVEVYADGSCLTGEPCHIVGELVGVFVQPADAAVGIGAAVEPDHYGRAGF